MKIARVRSRWKRPARKEFLILLRSLTLTSRRFLSSNRPMLRNLKSHRLSRGLSVILRKSWRFRILLLNKIWGVKERWRNFWAKTWTKGISKTEKGYARKMSPLWIKMHKGSKTSFRHFSARWAFLNYRRFNRKTDKIALILPSKLTIRSIFSRGMLFWWFNRRHDICKFKK